MMINEMIALSQKNRRNLENELNWFTEAINVWLYEGEIPPAPFGYNGMSHRWYAAVKQYRSMLECTF